MHADAPYANIPIPLSLSSSVGLRYRVLNCLECGQGFLERNDEKMFRLNTMDMPGEAHAAADGLIHGICGNCAQQYTITIAIAVGTRPNTLPLFMQPQSIYVTSEPKKRLRDLHCFECGKAFFSVSDRIKSFVDNVNLTELLAVDRLGPMESRCKFQKCKQFYHVRV